jgi:undecaprenyl-diphosphatase
MPAGQVLLFLVLFVALAVAARAAGGTPLPGEAALLAVAGSARGGGLPGLVAAAAGPLVWSALVLAAAGALWVGGVPRAAAALVCAEAVAEGAALLTKALVDRPRPEDAVLHDALTAGTAAFPSSHAVRATVALAVLLAAAWPRLGRGARTVAALAAAAFLALVGWARLISGEHWPWDVLGGYLLGAAVASAAAHVVRRGAPATDTPPLVR